MITERIQKWLGTLDLNLEQQVLAEIALALAREFDDKHNTSTAAELRKTILELQRTLKGSGEEYDPLAEMLTR